MLYEFPEKNVMICSVHVHAEHFQYEYVYRYTPNAEIS